MTIEDQSRVDIAEMRALHAAAIRQSPAQAYRRSYFTAAMIDALPALLTELEATRAAAERIAELEAKEAWGHDDAMPLLLAIKATASSFQFDRHDCEHFVREIQETIESYPRAALQRKEPGALQGRER